MSAKSAFFIALAAAVLMLLPLLAERRRQKNPFAAKNPKLPYLRRPLMTPTETDVYAALLEALPDYMVFAQVQASRVLEVPKSRETYYWFNFVSRLSYDFVVCRADSTPIAVIEVDDCSHERAERQEAGGRGRCPLAGGGNAAAAGNRQTHPQDRPSGGKMIFRLPHRLGAA